MDYKRADYCFELPPDRIAQHPAERREFSHLLVARGDKPLEDRRFKDLVDYLKPGDCLVLNQTRVMNARCFGKKDNDLEIEVFILDITGSHSSIPVLLKPARRVKQGMTIHFPIAGVTVEIVEKGEFGRAVARFESQEALQKAMGNDGQVPLPPYIQRDSGPSTDDEIRYQTVFAREAGAVAAPTAGLHFSEQLIDHLQEQGVNICKVTHHVGIGTFRPITVEDIREHNMDSEHYHLDESSADLLNKAKTEGRRIIAVGTTSTRCLESCCQNGKFVPGRGDTELFIYPPYQFKAIDGLITNFHLPGSTLMLLVSALMGREKIMSIYQHALKGDYRFYSYGDAMLLIP